MFLDDASETLLESSDELWPAVERATSSKKRNFLIGRHAPSFQQTGPSGVASSFNKEDLHSRVVIGCHLRLGT